MSLDALVFFLGLLGHFGESVLLRSIVWNFKMEAIGGASILTARCGVETTLLRPTRPCSRITGGLTQEPQVAIEMAKTIGHIVTTMAPAGARGAGAEDVGGVAAAFKARVEQAAGTPGAEFPNDRGGISSRDRHRANALVRVLRGLHAARLSGVWCRVKNMQVVHTP